MVIILYTLLTVVPILFSVPYSPYIITILSILSIGYFIICLRKASSLRRSRKLIEDNAEKEDEIIINIKKEFESDFIDRTTNMLLYIFGSLFTSILILLFFKEMTPLIEKALLITIIFCLITAIYLFWSSPFHEDRRKWEKHYRDFCKNYMDDRYQEFRKEERRKEKGKG